MSNFVHLHVHTEHSLLDGISKSTDIINKAKKLDMAGVCRTDHGNMFNMVSFYKQCKETNIKPIIGTELYIAPGSRTNKVFAENSKNKEDLSDITYYAYHLTVLAKNRVGYENLKQISTKAYREGFYRKPRADIELLTEYKDGLIVLSGCLASLTSRYIIAGKKEEAMREINKMRTIFGEDFYIELMYHGIEEDKILNEALIDISKQYGIPMVMTNDSHFTDEKDTYAHEVALAIGTAKKMSDENRFKFNGTGYWFKTEDEMIKTATDAGIPVEAIQNTKLVADKIDDYGFKLGSFMVPKFIDDSGKTLTDDECHKTLHDMAYEGLKTRKLDDKKEYQERLAFELDMIKRKNFSSYFLIIADIINFMRKSGILAPIGRGSSGGALTCYCLYVTGVDPIKFDIPFSRFMNEGRKDLPDIDTDISQERRQEILEHIVNKYGKDRVAQITTFQTMASKAALDNVGRALDVPVMLRRQVNDSIGDVTKDDKLDELLNTNEKVLNTVTGVPHWYEVAKVLEGNNRNLGEHAAGVVISNEPIDKVVPLINDSKSGHIRTQFDMKDLTELGLLKLDMLGLKTMDIIQHTIELIKDRTGIVIDFQDIPIDDKKTFDMLNGGKWVSVFQYDSSGFRAVVKQLVPENFEHLVALNALYRPGPMLREGGNPSIMEQYIERRHGRQQIEVWHPLLKEPWSKTYGLPLYQESLMAMAKVMAGFDDSEADAYRSAVGKKVLAKLQAANEKFVKKGMALGHSEETMKMLVAKTEGFARYGWNRAHGVEYSYLSYVTAYFEANFPHEYYTVILNANLDDNKQLKTLLSSIIQHGIEIKRPDINKSKAKFNTDGKSIFMGISSVRQVGDKATDAIIKDRDQLGPYKGYLDFCIRMGKYSKEVTSIVKTNLVRAGAFDFDTTLNAKEKIDNIDLIQKKIKKFEGKNVDILGTIVPLIVNSKEYEDHEKLEAERNVLNFYISSHPISNIQLMLKYFPDVQYITPSMVQSQELNKRVFMIGLVEEKTMKTTKTGNPYMVLKLVDQFDVTYLYIWDPMASNYADKISNQQILYMNGTIKENKIRPGEVQFNVNKMNVMVNNSVNTDQFIVNDYSSAITVIDAIGGKAKEISGPINGCYAVLLQDPVSMTMSRIEPIKHLNPVFSLWMPK